MAMLARALLLAAALGWAACGNGTAPAVPGAQLPVEWLTVGGHRITAEIEGLRLGLTFFDPYVAIMDSKRFELARSDDAPLLRQDCVASIIAPEDGTYIIAARETSFAGNGSCTKTSSPAPRMRRSRKACNTAGSSSTRPREMFTKIAEGFIKASSGAPMRFSVCALRGTHRQTKSDSANKA